MFEPWFTYFVFSVIAYEPTKDGDEVLIISNGGSIPVTFVTPLLKHPVRGIHSIPGN